MHIPPGQPLGYQRAAWAAAGLRAPPGGMIGVRMTNGYHMQEGHGAREGLSQAEAAELQAALDHSRAEGFQLGAAAATLEANRTEAERAGAVMVTLHQAAESH